MFERSCNISRSNSFFLLGARGTGKTTLLKQSNFLNSVVKIDLLLPEEESRYALNPELLYELCMQLPLKSWVIIDEVQKLPKLLDIVHKIIEERKIKFALTGSSARKLKRGGANLLAGRAFVHYLFPLTYREVGNRFDLHETLAWGTLPKIYDFDSDRDKHHYLSSYVHTYIKEEIQVEQLVRNLDPFRLFLRVAAQMNSEIINYSNISKDTGVDIKSVQNYFQILCDTHLGYLLTPYDKSVRKVQRKSPKFYFFDTGVARALGQLTTVELSDGTTEFGALFETWFINECIREISYRENDFRLSYLRTKDDVEIDLIIERPGRSEILVEIKPTNKVDERHLRSLEHFSGDFSNADFLCVSRDPIARRKGHIQIVPWNNALDIIFG